MGTPMSYHVNPVHPALLLMAGVFAVAPLQAIAQIEERTLQVDEVQVRQWNRFAEQLYELHEHQLEKRTVYTEKESGGYVNQPDYYLEVSYYDKQNDNLLSRIQWESEQPDTIHSIAVYIYDEQGELLRDYLAAYLPEFRNAPVQTLVNLHHVDSELKAFRQFDASGNRIYEQCSGKHFGDPFMLSLEEHQIPAAAGHLPEDISQELYESCFGGISAEAGKYLDPLSDHQGAAKQLSVSKDIDRLAREIEQNPENVHNYVVRSRHWLSLHEFDRAIADLDRALQIDDGHNAAYFWRGMAHGRNGEVEQGIADLTVYINRVPGSSNAYTKRGVRYIWNGEIKKAKQDFLKAIELDSNNAEAHDDLGVIYAQQGEHERAVSHFEKVIEIDPSYQKGYHNLAMTYFIQDQYLDASRYVNQALALKPDSRISLKLKGEILAATGQHEQADLIRKKAALMPEQNWTEQWPD